MTNGDVNRAMAEDLRLYELPRLPDHIVDRDGRQMDLNGAVWKFNVATTHVSFNWSKLEGGNLIVNYALRRWVLLLLTQQSPRAAALSLDLVANALCGRIRSFGAASAEVARVWRLMGVSEDLTLLRSLIEKIIQALRASRAMESFYRIRQWYEWSSDVLACLGFDQEFALELDQVSVPGRSSRLAVEICDDERGPLWDIEVTALRQAILSDESTDRAHVMQRVAVALCLAYGRNPANFCLLREVDFKNMLAGYNVPEQWVLAIPRIKKPGIGARRAFIEEHVSDDLAGLIRTLVEANKMIDCGDYPRPMFMRDTVDRWLKETGVNEFGYHITVDTFRLLLERFASRMRLKSPRTMRPMQITPRRLRYTFATTMVELGVSRRVLAAMLDHSDTQHVQVYYSLKGRRLTTILDRAAALKLGPLMRLFRGTLVPSPSNAVSGSDSAKNICFVGDTSSVTPVEIGACGQNRLCTLDPPFSCYLCPKFQPYVESDHRAVLDELLASRQERQTKYGLRLSIQLDDVIYAVAQVIREVDEYVRGSRKKT
ncbi:site-specific integrase [Burkholderia territorii]|uniref:site-specific integrase n=1 Tax=Burkholderia territorii TaxID=1503055 RepID=UPI0009BEE026|nr:site-specific integrase [Burkholderia territorii]